MYLEFWKAFTLIFIAEMGDKTQILAMAFATKYAVKKVLVGIFFGSLLNHGLAVILGSYISTFIPINTLQIFVGFAFIGFALWSLKMDDGDENEDKVYEFNPIVTVAMAFFLGELGDKTQLTAITLASDALYPVIILCGTVFGMVITGGIGIIIGKKLGDRIPEFTIKMVSASIFAILGTHKLYQTLPDEYLTVTNISIFIAVVLIVALMMLKPVILKGRLGQDTKLKTKSRELFEYYNKVKENIDKTCLGEEYCGECQREKCMVGYIKQLIEIGIDTPNSSSVDEDFNLKSNAVKKDFNKDCLKDTLKITLDLIKENPNNMDLKNINKIRRSIETILFGNNVEEINDWIVYRNHITNFKKS